MPAPTISDLPALPTFPSGPGLPDQPGVFFPKFLAFLTALGTYRTEANAIATYLEGLSVGGGQPLDADLTAIAALTTTSFGRSVLDRADAAALRTMAGLVIGSDVQAFNATLAALAGLTLSQGDILYRDASGLQRLAAGTSGHFLKTLGAGANPAWAAASGGGSAPWYLSSAPTAASMTLVSGDATNLTLTDDTDAGLLFSAGSPVAGDKARLAERTVSSPSSDWTFTVRISAFTDSTNYSNVGITVRDATGGRLLTFGYNEAGLMQVSRYAAVGGAYSAFVFNYTPRAHLPKWLRAKFVSGSGIIEFYVSEDGKQWTKVGQETRSAYLANDPNRVGFGVVYARTTSSIVVGSVSYLALV